MEKREIAKKKSEQKNIVLFLLLCMIGGTTYAFQKIGVENGLPLWTAGVRFLIAGGILICCSLLKGAFKYDKDTFAVSLQYGILYFALPFGAIYWVGQFLPSGLLSVLSASVAVFSVIFNLLFKGEKTTKNQVFGIFFSMLGVIAIFIQSSLASYNQAYLLSLTVALIAYIGAAYATALLKNKVQNIYPLSFNGMSLLFGGSILCIVSLFAEHGNRLFHGKALFSLVYLAIAGSMFATRITTYLMSQWHVAKVTMYRFVAPVISLLAGFLLFKEILHCYEIVGVVLIIVGIVFINK